MTTVDLNKVDSKTRHFVLEAKGGNEIVFMEGDKPIARIVPVDNSNEKPAEPPILNLKTFQMEPKLPLPSRSELADEMFGE